MSFVWNAGLTPIPWDGMEFNNNGVQVVHSGWPEKFLGQQFSSFLPGSRINSQYQGIWHVATTTGQEVVLSGYLPLVDAVFENSSGLITVQTNVPPDPNVTVDVWIYGSGGPTPASLDNNGVVSFQTPSNMALGEHPFAVQVVSASSAWVLHNFGTPTPPTITSFTANPTTLPLGNLTSFSCDVSGATQISIDNGIGDVPSGCAITVQPKGTTTYTLTATNPGGTVTATVTVTVMPATPVINAGGVVNAATFDARFSPASIIAVFGQNLAGGTASALFQQGAFVPSWADPQGNAIQVTVDGKACALIYVSPTQVNCQLSWATAVGSPLTVQSIKGSMTSNTETITLTPTAPAPFMYQGMAIVTDSNYQLVTANNPAKQGGVYTLWLQGLGTTSNQPADGVPFGSELGVAQATVSLTFSGNEAKIPFAGGAPGEIINQLNFVFPEIPSTSTGLVNLTGKLSVGNQSISLVVPVLYGNSSSSEDFIRNCPVLPGQNFDTEN